MPIMQKLYSSWIVVCMAVQFWIMIALYMLSLERQCMICQAQDCETVTFVLLKSRNNNKSRFSLKTYACQSQGLWALDLSYGSCGKPLGVRPVANQTILSSESFAMCIQLASTRGWICQIFGSMPIKKGSSRRYFSTIFNWNKFNSLI
jgi:hypothetical protein